MFILTTLRSLNPVAAAFYGEVALNLLSVQSLAQLQYVAHKPTSLSEEAGKLITANLKLDENRDIIRVDFCLEGRVIFNVFTNELNKDLCSAALNGEGKFLAFCEEIGAAFNWIANERDDVRFEDWTPFDDRISLSFVGGDLERYYVEIPYTNELFSWDAELARFRTFYLGDEQPKNEMTVKWLDEFNKSKGIHFDSTIWTGEARFDTFGNFAVVFDYLVETIDAEQKDFDGQEAVIRAVKLILKPDALIEEVLIVSKELTTAQRIVQVWNSQKLTIGETSEYLEENKITFELENHSGNHWEPYIMTFEDGSKLSIANWEEPNLVGIYTVIND